MPRQPDPHFDPQEFEEVIRSSRFSLAEIASAAGVSRVYLSQILGKEQKRPSAEKLKQILRAISRLQASASPSLVLYEIYDASSPSLDEGIRLWRVTQSLLTDSYAACRDHEERRRFLETLWVPMRMAWWTRGSSQHVANCRREMPPTASEQEFRQWLSARTDLEDLAACTLGLLCWREPEMMFALYRAGAPAAFNLGLNHDRIPQELLEVLKPGW